MISRFFLIMLNISFSIFCSLLSLKLNESIIFEYFSFFTLLFLFLNNKETISSKMDLITSICILFKFFKLISDKGKRHKLNISLYSFKFISSTSSFSLIIFLFELFLFSIIVISLIIFKLSLLFSLVISFCLFTLFISLYKYLTCFNDEINP